MSPTGTGTPKADADAEKKGGNGGEGGSLGVAKTQAQIDKSNAEDVARTQAEAGVEG
jgi:hypothetical protein